MTAVPPLSALDMIMLQRAANSDKAFHSSKVKLDFNTFLNFDFSTTISWDAKSTKFLMVWCVSFGSHLLLEEGLNISTSIYFLFVSSVPVISFIIVYFLLVSCVVSFTLL